MVLRHNIKRSIVERDIVLCKYSLLVGATWGDLTEINDIGRGKERQGGNREREREERKE